MNKRFGLWITLAVSLAYVAYLGAHWLPLGMSEHEMSASASRVWDVKHEIAAHHYLPLGTVVRVINTASKQEVHVTINDRCAPKSFHFIDLSRAAAKKIGLWGKGRIKVVITPLLEERVEEPA